MIPVLQALVLAEKVYKTAENQSIIVGTFNRIRIGAKDAQNADDEGRQIIYGGKPGSPYAYISLTDVCDQTEIELQFVSLSRNVVIFEQSMTITCKNRLATVEIICALPHLSVAEEGVYAFEVVCEGEVIGSHRISALREDGQSNQG